MRKKSKNRFSRILGVGLTFALAASLLVVAAPASAGTLGWGAEKNPSTLVTNTLGAAGLNVVDLTVSGDNVYVATTDTAGANETFKFTDAGMTWAKLTKKGNFKLLAAASDDSDILVGVTKDNIVWYSSNGGSTYTSLGVPDGDDANILAVDVSAGATRYIAAAGDDGSTTGAQAQLYTIKVGVAQSWAAEAGEGGFTANQTTINAVKFSPNFTTDNIIAVVSGNTTNSAWFQVFRWTSGQQSWNGSIDFFDATDWGTGIQLYTLTAAIASADIAFPSTYLGNDEDERVVFTSVATSVATNGGVTRLTNKNTADFDDKSGDAPGGIGSIAYHDGNDNLLGGDYSDSKIYRWLSPSSGSSPDASSTSKYKSPGGVDKTTVAWVEDNAIAATQGDESAWSVSTDDGYAFNDVALIDTDLQVMSDVAVNADGSKVYLTTSNATDTSVWLKDTTWTRIFSTDQGTTAKAAFLVRIAPEDDSVVYLASKTSTDVWKSKNSGQSSWTKVTAYKLDDVRDMVVESADVVYAIDDDSVSKTSNGGSTWGSGKSPTDSFTPYMITLGPNNDVLMGGENGYVAYSKDGGSTIYRTKVVNAGVNVQVVADVDYDGDTNNTIYAGSGTTVKRGKADTTTSWASRSPTFNSNHAVTGIGIDESVVYVLSANSTNSDLHRALDLKNAASSDAPLPYWSVKVDSEDLNAAPQALKMSGTKLWAIDTPNVLSSFTDPIAKTAPTPTAPVDAATVNLNEATGKAYDITFTWTRQNTSIDASDIEIATDADFSALVYSNEFTGHTTATIAKVIGPNGNDGTAQFMPGETYYWRVRTSETGPMYSPWSTARTFIVGVPAAPAAAPAVIADVSLLSPEKGVSDVGLDPTFVWSAYEGAIGYEIVVAQQADFKIIEYSHNVPADNTWYRSEPLAYDTAYYWRVRGVTGPLVGRGPAPGGPWAVSTFNTMSEPVPAAPAVKAEPTVITITEPAPPAPPAEIVTVEVPVPIPAAPQAIPSYLLWAVIGIGAILVIALIVLIVRTRRVA